MNNTATKSNSKINSLNHITTSKLAEVCGRTNFALMAEIDILNIPYKKVSVKTYNGQESAYALNKADATNLVMDYNSAVKGYCMTLIDRLQDYVEPVSTPTSTPISKPELSVVPARQELSPIESSSEVTSMSSVEIAELTGKRHADVTRDIRNTLEAAEINVSRFAHVYQSGINKGKVKLYNLPKRECDLVVSGYSVKYRLAIIDRWQELESGQQFAIPKTLTGALRLAADIQEKLEVSEASNLLLSEQVEDSKEAVDFYSKIIDQEGLCTITTVSNRLGIGRNTFFTMLQQDGVIGGIESAAYMHNVPYQKYKDMGFFKNKQVIGNLAGKLVDRTFVTHKGYLWMVKKYS